MNTQNIAAWLQRRKSGGATANALLSAVALLGGVIVLFLTFWFTYAIIWFVFPGVSAAWSLVSGKKLFLAHHWRLVIAGVFVVLLFIQHLRTSQWHWGDYPVRDDYSPIAGHVLGPWALLRYPGASANMIADTLLTGPRLVTGSWTLLRQSRRLRQLDVEGCSQLLAFLASRPGAVPFEELRAAGWEDWFEQLRHIEGVVFLQKGLNLSGALRKELAELPSD